MSRLHRPSIRELLAATMLGVGAIFGQKANPEDHWSVSPKLRTDVLIVSEARGSGDGPELDLAPPPVPTLRRRSSRLGRRLRRMFTQRR